MAGGRHSMRAVEILLRTKLRHGSDFAIPFILKRIVSPSGSVAIHYAFL
jgi:hypothetical protein